MDYLRDPVKLAEVRRRAEAKVQALIEEEAPDMTDRAMRLRLIKEVMDEALGLGPLEDLLADPAVTEIMVNGAHKIYVERKGKLELSGVAVHQQRSAAARDRAHRRAPSAGASTRRCPMVDARLADGSRVNAIIPPLALDGPALTIRKFAKSLPDGRRSGEVRVDDQPDGDAAGGGRPRAPEHRRLGRHRLRQDDAAEPAGVVHPGRRAHRHGRGLGRAAAARRTTSSGSSRGRRTSRARAPSRSAIS